MIWLYRRPILDYWAEHEETLGAIITHVLIHEIGHHFGLSDDDMEKIEAKAGLPQIAYGKHEKCSPSPPSPPPRRR